MKKIFLFGLSIFLLGCTYDPKYDGRIVVDCKKREVIQLKHNVGDNYFIYILPLTVDSSCHIKEDVETYLNKGK